MFGQYAALIKGLGVVIILGLIAYFSYDYGVTSTAHAAQVEQNRLLDKLETKQNEAFKLAVELATQEPIVDIQYRTVEKKVLVYAQENPDKQCVSSDTEWLRIRSDAVRAHNQSIGVQSPAPVTHDPTEAATGARYRSDAEVLAEDVYNLKTCAENAQKLDSLQRWIRAQLPE
ncbi:hypothetical protein L1D52_24015 [Vibrio brasiliensis]|uniref:hypothetical protein n=1 Tax=Vibrio brasiliensis TaxID=170652 RepID=UPI001EFE07AC|nr:hypothetical protein [Vibrio brasiliensis]MCG9785378.1 hypothetical protein [Vibrio brasiliensis]